VRRRAPDCCVPAGARHLLAAELFSLLVGALLRGRRVVPSLPQALGVHRARRSHLLVPTPATEGEPQAAPLRVLARSPLLRAQLVQAAWRGISPIFPNSRELSQN
jgi:hypothetical protein